MQKCDACGFANRPDRDSCLKCGQVFREQKDFTPLLKKIGGVVVGVLVVGVALLRIFGPSKMEAKRMRFEEREARKNRAEEAPVAKPAAPREPEAVPKEEPKPPPRPAEPEELTPRQQGELHFRNAEQRYAQGDYSGAAEEYQKAERLGSSTPKSQERRKICADIAYIVMYRDYLDREKVLEPSRLIGAKSNLARIDSAALPTDAWREEYRKTQARVDKAHKELSGEDTRGGNYAAQPPPPRPTAPPPPKLVTDAVWKNMKFLLKPVAPDGGKMDGAAFTEVAPDGLAAKAGIRVGDVLVEINDQPVTTLNQVINLRSTIDRDRGWWGVVRRGDQRVPFRVDIPGGK